MKKHLLQLAVFALAATPAMAQKIFVDFDSSADFGGYETFAWAPTPETSLQQEAPLMHSRLKNAIEYHLTTGGLREVDKDPDLYVTYHTSAKEETTLRTTNMGYGYGPGWGWGGYWGGGMGSSTTTAHSYHRGTLIIDIWDAKKKQAIWRGSAKAVIKQNPQSAAKQIDKMVNKIVKKWQKMYEKELKKRAKKAS